ncbi:MAG: hypothetical protein HND56_12010 [Pseudomonadota bacterium]|nr:hypothetical protein [Pseudomonadota bacterium]QKK06365.1 MAG: hypothetical protein HND56_12010 [Pseudomonadota bacterium]
MAYHLWYSEKSADMHAGKTEEKHWNGGQAWTDIGYAIAADRDGNLIQYMDAGDRVSPAVQGHDRHAYIVAIGLEKEDFRVLVNRKGEINEALAAELDIKPELEVIKSLTVNFYEPLPTRPVNPVNPMKNYADDGAPQEFTFQRPKRGL